MDSDHRREVMDALGEKTRYDIVTALIERELTGDEIAAAVGRSRSTVESHLSMLLRLGLISREMRDRSYYYRVTPLASKYLREEPVAESPLPTEAHRDFIYHRHLWAIFSAVGGAIYVVVNQYLYPFPIFGTGILFGVASAVLFRSLSDVVKAVFATAFVISFIAYLIAFGSSPISFLFSYVVSLVYLAIGLAVWTLIRSFRRLISGFVNRS